MFHVKHEYRLLIYELLKQDLSELGLSFDSCYLDRVIDYFILLLEKNKCLNLISPKQDLPTQVTVHLVDSLTPLLWDNWPEGCKALDIGSGGGLPAIPLSLYFTDWTYHLCEATGKKAAFLDEVKSTLHLDNIEVLSQFLKPGYNCEGLVYNFISARAVTNIANLADIAGPRLARGGVLLSFKGPLGDDEYKKAAPILKKRKLSLLDRLDLKLPKVGARRSLFLFEKK